MSLLEVGTVIKPHGVRGDVKVRLHWSGSDALSHVTQVVLRQGHDEHAQEIERLRTQPQGLIVKLRGVDDREAAEQLRGAVLLVPRSNLPDLEPGEYYLADLVGCEARVGERSIGKVVEVRTHPSVDSCVIEAADGSRTEQPLTEPWVREVDVQRGVLILESEDGLI